MPTPDDPQFEQYLKRFRPLPPEPLPVLTGERRNRPRYFVAAWALLAAAVVVATMFLLHPRPSPTIQVGTNPVAAEAFTLPPRTIGEANALLAHATSVKMALNTLAFQHSSATIPPGRQSAFAVLSKEKSTL